MRLAPQQAGPSGLPSKRPSYNGRELIKKDFGDAIFVTGYEFDLSDEKFRYSAKGGEKAYVFKLDEVEKYAKEKNKEIIRVARERANGYIDWDREYVIPGFVSGQF